MVEIYYVQGRVLEKDNVIVLTIDKNGNEIAAVDKRFVSCGNNQFEEECKKALVLLEKDKDGRYAFENLETFSNDEKELLTKIYKETKWDFEHIGGSGLYQEESELIKKLENALYTRWDRVVNFGKSFLPQRIPNEITYDALYALSKIRSVPQEIIQMHRDINSRLLVENMEICSKEYKDGAVELKANTYIEHQGEWSYIKFGVVSERDTMAYSGCGIIATYNATFALEGAISKETMVNLISEFEAEGSVIQGVFGTAPEAIANHFDRNGYDTELVISDMDRETINSLGETSDVTIVTVYNDKYDLGSMIHTVCITKDVDGYSTHNAGYMGPYNSLQDAIDSISSDPSIISVIGISKKEETVIE